MCKKAAPNEQITYQFFLTPKNIQNLAYQLQMKLKVDEDDYEMVKQTITRWLEKNMVTFYQPYSFKNENPKKRPFVLIIHTPQMLKRAKLII